MDPLTQLAVGGAVVAVGAVIAFWKALLITAAILAVPFAIWWTIDHGKQRTEKAERDRAVDEEARRRRAAPVDYEAEAKRAEDAGMPASARLWREQSDPWKA